MAKGGKKSNRKKSINNKQPPPVINDDNLPISEPIPTEPASDEQAVAEDGVLGPVCTTSQV